VFVAACCRGMSIEGPRQAMVIIEGLGASGRIMLEQASINSPVKIRGTIHGLESGLHGLAVHDGSQLGARCRSVGAPLESDERYDTSRPAGYLGNVKVRPDGLVDSPSPRVLNTHWLFCGTQSFAATPSRADISLISSKVSLFEESDRSIMDRPLVIYSSASLTTDPEDFMACGMIQAKSATSRLPTQRDLPSWTRSMESNLNLEGIKRPKLSADSLSLKSGAATHKGNKIPTETT